MKKFPRASFVKAVLADFSGSTNRWLPKDFWHPTHKLKMKVRDKIMWAVMYRLVQPTSWSVCPQNIQMCLKLKLQCLLPEHFKEEAGFIQRKRKKGGFWMEYTIFVSIINFSGNPHMWSKIRPWIRQMK